MIFASGIPRAGLPVLPAQGGGSDLAFPIFYRAKKDGRDRAGTRSTHDASTAGATAVGPGATKRSIQLVQPQRQVMQGLAQRLKALFTQVRCPLLFDLHDAPSDAATHCPALVSHAYRRC